MQCASKKFSWLSAVLVQGEGRAALAGQGLMLGQQLPPITLQLKDAAGNPVPAAAELEGLALMVQTREGGRDLDLVVRAQQV